MGDIDLNKKSRKRNNEKRYDEIAIAIRLFLKESQITTNQYVAQENHMKKIQVKVFLQPNQ